jgi:hypothetical protein
MKNQMIHLIKTAATAVLVASCLTLVVSCNQGNPTRQNKQSTETAVKPPNMDIHTAAILGDLDVIDQHIRAGTDLDLKEPSMGSTALITAAVFGKTEIAIALIEAGADVNIKNNEGSTALHSAAFLCRTVIVRALLDNGVDKTLKNNYGSTALESVTAPFDYVKPIYDQFSKDLGPLGLKLDYDRLERTRPVIAGMLQ